MKRHTASTITDHALDELYENATRGWRRGDEWKARAVTAEAALERLADWCERLDKNAQQRTGDPSAQHPVAANIRQQLAQTEETSTP
jgi:hypothetical protein